MIKQKFFQECEYKHSLPDTAKNILREEYKENKKVRNALLED